MIMHGKLTVGVPLNHDNAPAHNAAVAMAVIHEYRFPPYSPVLAPTVKTRKFKLRFSTYLLIRNKFWTQSIQRKGPVLELF